MELFGTNNPKKEAEDVTAGEYPLQGVAEKKRRCCKDSLQGKGTGMHR
jgi:hypothetical protein